MILLVEFHTILKKLLAPKTRHKKICRTLYHSVRKYGIIYGVVTILHVDMDAFFASVEVLHHPEWRGKPVIVGSSPHERGVVSTCSYEARRFGVHSAMPSRTAYEKCPQGIFTPVHMGWYKEVSHQAFEVFEHYTPFVEGVSIDEAFLDVTGTLHLYGGDAIKMGEALRAEIARVCGVTCSVGIGPNRLLAKIGSDQKKPNGLTLMPFAPDAITGFLRPKPISILWGVGEKTERILRPYGITTCGDVQRVDEAQLRTILKSESAAEILKRYSFGIDSSVVAWEETEEKSVSREYTFGEDEAIRDVVRAKLLELVQEVGRRFRREKRWARTARIKVRDTDFNTITRQISFEDGPARDDLSFRKAALELFDAFWPIASGNRFRKIRLIGFGVTNFQTSAADEGMFDLFEDKRKERRQKNERLSATLDALHEKGLL